MTNTLIHGIIDALSGSVSKEVIVFLISMIPILEQFILVNAGSRCRIGIDFKLLRYVEVLSEAGPGRDARVFLSGGQ